MKSSDRRSNGCAWLFFSYPVWGCFGRLHGSFDLSSVALAPKGVDTLFVRPKKTARKLTVVGRRAPSRSWSERIAESGTKVATRLLGCAPDRQRRADRAFACGRQMGDFALADPRRRLDPESGHGAPGDRRFRPIVEYG